MPQLSELVLHVPVYYRDRPRTEAALSTSQREAYIDTHEDHGRQWWINQGSALLLESDVTTPLTLTVVWIVRDRENDTMWNRWATKTFLSVTVTVKRV